MATVSVLNQSMDFLQLENILLKQKVLQLTRLCEHHKSHYEQLKAKCEVEYNNAREIHSFQINGLMQQIHNQKQKLSATQHQLKQAQQLAERTAIEHKNKVRSLQQENQNMQKEIQGLRLLMETYDARKTEEINKLKNELIHERDKIRHLDKTLAAYEQYTSFRSPSVTALKITRSKSTSSSKTRIWSSPELSAFSIDIKYANRNHDISPVPRLSLSSRGYDHAHLMPSINTNRRYRKRKMRHSLQNKKRSMPSPIDISLAEAVEGAWLTDDSATDDIDADDTPISSGANTPSLAPITPYAEIKTFTILKNSVTQISDDSVHGMFAQKSM
eukprot:274178_1